MVPLRRLSLGRASVIYLSLAMTLTVYHAFAINLPFRVHRTEYHQQIVANSFKSPYQYRVMAPFLAEAGGWTIQHILDLPEGRPADLAREVVYLGLRFCATLLLLVVFHRYLETWFSPEMAFSGTLLLAGLHLYTFRSYFYQPSSFLEILFLALGAYCVVRGYTRWLYPLAFVASLARETTGLLVPLYVAFIWPDRRGLRRAIGILLAWLAAQVVLRLILGFAPSVFFRPISEDFYYRNIPWPIFLFGLLWLIPAIWSKRLPPFLRRAMFLFIPPLIVANFLFGKVEETRMFLPAAIILIPSTLFVLLSGRDTVRDEGANPVPA